jgi:hypothetical protein
MQAKANWQPMEIAEVGDVAEIVKVGEGKLSTEGGDPGENRKESGTEDVT